MRPVIGLYSPWDLDDPHAWSGMPHQALKALEARAEVIRIPRAHVSDSFKEKAIARVRGWQGKRSLPRHTVATARRRSREAGRLMAKALEHRPDIEAIVTIAASTDVLDAPISVPLVQVTDATFPAVLDFYPFATGLGPRGSRQGRTVEKLSAESTAAYVVASTWAAQSLTRDVGVPHDRVVVAPFGPGIDSPHSVPRRTTPSSQLRLLLVAADWSRKRGHLAVELASRLREERDVTLTVIGEAPTSLPDWVDCRGRVSRDVMPDVYRNHDVLLDPSNANAAGVVLTDALIAGLPVLCCAVGGAADIVRHGHTGWTVDPESFVSEGAALLGGIDAGLLRTLSSTARDDAGQRLSWDRWGDTVIDALGRVRALSESDDHSTSPHTLSASSLVMLSPTLPSRAAQETAGEKLLLDYIQAGQLAHEVTLIVPDGPANRRALERGQTPHHVVVTGRGHDWLDGLRLKVENLAQLRRPFTRQTLNGTTPLLKGASHIDLQWEETGLLLPALRRLNPKARYSITLHDVLSQKYARQAREQSDFTRRFVWNTRARAARVLERIILRYADDVIVLSNKDAELLPHPHRGHAQIRVVPPPITGDLRSEDPARSTSPTLLFVGFLARWENEDAVLWFLSEILPEIRRTRPDVTVKVAGGGLRPHVVNAMNANDVDVLGFVDDLEPLYEEAAVAVVPLRFGAGVKFKVVEALVRGVPVVTTSVGNEGITPADAAMVADDAADIAREVLTALSEYPRAEAHARRMAVAISQQFGVEPFYRALRKVYS